MPSGDSKSSLGLGRTWVDGLGGDSHETQKHSVDNQKGFRDRENQDGRQEHGRHSPANYPDFCEKHLEPEQRRPVVAQLQGHPASGGSDERPDHCSCRFGVNSSEFRRSF